MSFISYLINGISLGSVYAIIALGYTMVYGIAKMLNFAHGDVLMVGSFAVFTIVSTLGLPPILGILVAVVVYMTRDFWLSIAWWVYLLTAGIGLITFAAVREKRRDEEEKQD